MIWDDGTLPNLAGLSKLQKVMGPLYVYGVNGNDKLLDLTGLENLQVKEGGTLERGGKPGKEGGVT